MSTKNIWFSSDLHLGHSNIIHLCNRPFQNLQQMEETIIANHNAVVGVNDCYYDLGDVGYKCDATYLVQRLKRLNGKLKIILGNHDKPLRQAVDRGMVDDLIESGKLEIIGSTNPNIMTAYQINYNKRSLVLSHYAYRTWNRAFRGAIHLYGHSHNNLSSHYCSFDVGVDANEFFPISIHQVIKRADAIGQEFSEK